MCRKSWFLSMYNRTIDAPTKSTCLVTWQLLSVSCFWIFPPFLENFNHFLVFIAQTDTVVKPKNKLWNSCVKIMLSDKHFKGEYSVFESLKWRTTSCTSSHFISVCLVNRCLFAYIFLNFFSNEIVFMFDFRFFFQFKSEFSIYFAASTFFQTIPFS